MSEKEESYKPVIPATKPTDSTESSSSNPSSNSKP